MSEKTFIFIPNLANSLDEKEKVGSARKVTRPALQGYPFLIVGSNSKQGFLGWNHHCLFISYVSLMLSDKIIALIRGNTKKHHLKHYQQQQRLYSFLC